MRRLALVIAAIAALAIGVAAARLWIVCCREPTAAVHRESPAQHAAPSSVRAPALEEPPADLTLQVNGSTSAPLRPAEAMFFTVTLGATTPALPFALGAEGKPWSADVRFVSADGTALPWRVEVLGRPETYRLGRAQSEMHQADFGIAPEETARMPAGRHAIRVLLDLADTRVAGGRLASNTVHVTVGSQAAADDAHVKLEAAARFELRAERWEHAHRLTAQLIARPNADATAYILFGDALNGLGRHDEALAAYHQAMSLVPKDLDESPDYLVARMNQVQDRLAASRPPR